MCEFEFKCKCTLPYSERQCPHVPHECVCMLVLCMNVFPVWTVGNWFDGDYIICVCVCVCVCARGRSGASGREGACTQATSTHLHPPSVHPSLLIHLFM